MPGCRLRKRASASSAARDVVGGQVVGELHLGGDDELLRADDTRDEQRHADDLWERPEVGTQSLLAPGLRPAGRQAGRSSRGRG